MSASVKGSDVPVYAQCVSRINRIVLPDGLNYVRLLICRVSELKAFSLMMNARATEERVMA